MSNFWNQERIEKREKQKHLERKIQRNKEKKEDDKDWLRLQAELSDDDRDEEEKKEDKETEKDLQAHAHITVHTAVDEYIQNKLPLRVLSLPSMEMVSRGALKKDFEPAIEKMVKDCVLESDNTADLILSMVKKETAYAILSHRWLAEGELTFRNMSLLAKHIGGFRKLLKRREGMPRHQPLRTDTIFKIAEEEDKGKGKEVSGTALATMKRLCKGMSADEKGSCGGLVKLVEFCEVAQQRDYKYVWFDTGCINKESSAELEESIRSMFNWYRNSALCIIHLNETIDACTLMKDPWFTRGWTLQELLAPTQIKFFKKSWTPITDEPNDKIKLDVPLWAIISRITAIPVAQLLSFEPGVKNVRQRMVWASKRKTTRIEDMAYCLVGIFNVGLSIAYGEGEMAFHRLQVEVMQRSPDRGLFAWQGEPSVHNSMFAAEPACFFRTKWGARVIEEEGTSQPEFADPTFTLTNHGLRITRPVYSVKSIAITAQEKNSDWVNYVFELEEGINGKFHVALHRHSRPKPKELRIAILGNVPFRSTLAILLRKQGPRNYKRLATKRIVSLNYLPRSNWIDPKTIFIV